VNFLAVHDGLTLHDLTSVTSDRHRSWDCGDELRPRQLRNMFCVVLLSRGTPLFVMGDEFGRTQDGDHNPYDRDDEVTWVDWTRLDEDDPNEVPEGEWVCLEWLNKGDTDEGRVWINDVEHPSLQTSATDHDGDDQEEYLLPEFDAAWFGWWHYQTGTNPPEFDVWIDEIVIDDERIGCVN
jgi:hypothetical protein